MIAVILAAGESTRMSPYHDAVIPKCLLPVTLEEDGRMTSLLHRLLRQSKEAGAARAVVVCNKKNYAPIEAALRAHIAPLPVSLEIQRMSGQLGALASGMRAADDNVLAIDGDNYFYRDLEMKEFRIAYDGVSDLLVSAFVADRTDKYAMMDVEAGRVMSIEEKPLRWNGERIAKGGLLYIPLHVHDLPEREWMLGATNTTELIGACGRAQIAFLSDAFVDIGTWDDYVRVLRSALGRRHG